jgi:hypothetical protein
MLDVEVRIGILKDDQERINKGEADARLGNFEVRKAGADRGSARCQGLRAGSAPSSSRKTPATGSIAPAVVGAH